MAVFGGFFKVVLFVVSILSIVSIVLPAECNNLLLFLNGKPHDQTEFLLPLNNNKNGKIRCVCSDRTQTVQWYFYDGYEVPPQSNGSQVYSRAKDKELEGSVLHIAKATPSQDYVGGYRCVSDMSNASISIVVKDRTIKVRVSPASEEVTVKNGTESLMLQCSITVVSGGTVKWTRNGANISNFLRHVVETTNSSSSLLINNLTKSDEGTYRCIYEMNGAFFQSNQANVFIAGFIQVSLESNSSLTVEVSTKVELSCVASGYQADMFMYQWRHDGNILINATDKALIIPLVADSDSGRYECAVTNHWGDVVTSNSTELVVTKNPPVITTHPSDTTVTLRYSNESHSAVFSCDANNGSSDIQYSWFSKTVDGDMMVVGATFSELNLIPVTVEMNNTQYYCVATNNSGNVTSESARLTVTTFIQVKIEPANVTTKVGTMATFECVAEGYRPDTFKYQWRFNNGMVANSSDKTLMLSSVTEDHSGMYECVVTNYWNVTAKSPPAQLIVTRNNPPVITTHPNDTTVPLHYGNESAVFICEANNGSSDIQYSWFNKTVDGDMILEGAITNELVLTSVTVEMNNTQYYCVATNNSRNVTSESARLTVTTFIQTKIEPANVTAEVGTMATFECIAEGYQPDTFKYQWRFNNSIVANSSNKTLMLSPVTEDHSGMYECVVTNYWNVTAKSSPAQLIITRNNPPVITSHPNDTTVSLHYGNESTTFSCVADGGSSDIQYSWFNKTDDDDDMILERRTTNTLMLTPVTVEMNNTQYYCVATNNSGNATSESARLTVTTFIEATIEPADVTTEVSTMATFECVAEGYRPDTFKYQWRFNNGMVANSSDKTLMLSPVTEDHSGMYECVVTNYWNVTTTSPSAQLIVTRNPPVITVHPNDTTVSLRYGNESAKFSCEANGGSSDIQYSWFNKTDDGDMVVVGAITNKLVLTSVTVGMNNTQYYCVATNNSGNVTSNRGHLTVKFAIDPPVILTQPPGTLELVVESSSDEITLNCTVEGEGIVYWQKDGVEVAGSRMPIAQGGNTLVIMPDNITSTNMAMYRCVASNIAGSVMSNYTSVTVTGSIEVTIEQSDLSVEVTTGVQLTCKADGYQSDMFTYQWTLNNTNIDGATSENYTIPSASEDDRGMYKCVVTNHWNEMATSSPLQLNVTRNPPVITAHPNDTTVSLRYGNEIARFSCKAVGGNSDIQYSWFTKTDDGDMMVVGATSSELVLTQVTVEMNDTQYYCVATNNSGNVTSNTGYLTVDFDIDPPVIVTQPSATSQLVVEYSSDNITLNCTVEGEGIVFWQKDGVEIADSRMPIAQDGNTLDIMLDSITSTNVGMYRCVASNVAGQVMSNYTSVTVTGNIEVTIQQSDLSVEVTTRVQLMCKADGYQSDMFTYQWTLNNASIDGATSENYTIPSASEDDRGMYKCVVTNHWNEKATSSPLQLNVAKNLPVIILGPQNMTVLITNGSLGKAEFSCVTEETASHRWTTIKQGTHNAHKTHPNRTSSVHRVNINLLNNGTQVYCEATNGSGTVQSQTATLTVLVPPPKIIRHPQSPPSVAQGDTIVFECEAESFGNNQTLQYQWLEVLENSSVPINGSNTSKLQFTVEARHDGASYQCAVTNENGTVYSSIGRLNLLPSIVVQPKNVNVPHNVSVTLYCEAIGGSNITYKWIKNNNTVALNSSNYGNLTIESVQPSDQGVYQCEAMNERGEVALSRSASVIIYDQFLLKINDTNGEHRVSRGNDVYISCEVNIQPSPSGGVNITWYRERTDEDLSSISELVEEDDTSYLTLHLEDIKEEDKGRYVCSVDNGNVTGGINTSVNVIVEYPPRITEFQEIGPVRIGANFVLSCHSTGVPSPIATLYFNDEKVFGGILSVVNHTVTNAGIGDNGTYNCTAISISKITGQPFPAVTKTIEVVIQGVPERIKKSMLDFTAINLTAINVTWSKPMDNNSPIRNYTVKCDKCPTKSITVDASVTNIVITGLSPGIEYKLSVAAANAIGSGENSGNIVAYSATPASTTVPFLDVTLNELSVMITWTDPKLYAPMIKEYTVQAVSSGHHERRTVPAGDHGVNITDLVPTFSYNVSIMVTYVVESFMSDPVIMVVSLPGCEACTKPEIMVPTNKNLSSLSFTLEWSTIDTGLLHNYTLSYYSIGQLPVVKRLTEREEITIPADSTSYTVENLTPFSSYCFTLEALYVQQDIVFDRQRSELCDINTPPLKSSAPLNLQDNKVDYRSVEISWSPPAEIYGVISKYKVYYFSEGVNMSWLTENADSLVYPITGLTPATQYTISVAAITYHPFEEDLEGPESNIIVISTLFAAPVVVSQLPIASSPNLDQRTVEITVPTIDDARGEMSHYLVVVVIGDLPSEFSAPRDIPNEQLLPYGEATDRGYNYYVATGSDSPQSSHILGNEEAYTVDSREYYNAALIPDQEYSYFLRIYSKHNSTTYSTSELSPHFVIASEDEETSSPLGIIIGVVAFVMVLIIIMLIVLMLYLIRVHSSKGTNNEAPLRDLPRSKERSPASAAPPQIERKLSVPFINMQSADVYTSVGPPTTLSVEVGGKPLPEVQWFKDGNPTVHRVLDDGSLYIEKTEISDGGRYTAIVTNAAGKSEESIHLTVKEPSPPKDDVGHPPIQVEDFAHRVALNRSNMEELFIEEYKDLEVEQMFSQHNAKLPINRSKNRYLNIIPYDHTRVTLETDYQVTGSDYINASYIDGYSGPREYIATQGPLASTFGDFWKMIWEKRCTTIVMLTNLKEDDKIKCHQYWPSYGSAMYDNFRVTLKSVETLAEYSIRVFSVERVNNGNNVLEVHQFHYTVWPDHGVPDYATPLLSFHSRVEKFFKRGGAPMVIHCSAGVGRTGTFIAIDTQMQRIRDQSNVDIFNNIRRLRYCRNYMVQTQSQYIFLHDVMLEAIMCGDTSLGAPVQNIVERLRNLAAVDQETNETLFIKQFKMLSTDVLQERKFTYNVATASQNVAKNRYQNHLAADQNFVCLPTTDDKPGYINASFVDGYRMRNAFLVTQGPLENTIEDFWEMIWEYKSNAVVMLTSLKENEKEQCCQYWPEKGSKEYGSFVVEALRFYEPIGGEFKREFKLSHVSNPMESRVITQFHYVKWPEGSCPDTGACMIDLIDSVERVQRKTGNGPITVHCNDGVGRSGTFCALVSSLERFKAEQMADIFQTIKKMRMQRAGMVQTPEQYEFLHKAVLEAIERFDTYSNFA